MSFGIAVAGVKTWSTTKNTVLASARFQGGLFTSFWDFLFVHRRPSSLQTHQPKLATVTELEDQSLLPSPCTILLKRLAHARRRPELLDS